MPEPGTTLSELTLTLTSTHDKSNLSLDLTVSPTPGEEKEAESSDSSGDGYDFLLLTLTTTPVPHMLDSSFPTEKMETEDNVSQESQTSVPESMTPSGFSVVEEEVMQVIKKEVGEEPVIYITSTPPAKTVTPDTMRHDDSSTEDDLSGKEETFGEVSTVTEHSDISQSTSASSLIFTSTVTLEPNVTDVDGFNDNDLLAVGVTMLDGATVTHTPNPTTPPQEFRADVEFSGDHTLIADPVPSTRSPTTTASTTEKPEKDRTATIVTATDDVEHENNDLAPTIIFKKQEVVESQPIRTSILGMIIKIAYAFVT